MDLLAGVPVLSEEDLRRRASQARLSIAHGGLGFLSTTTRQLSIFVLAFHILVWRRMRRVHVTTRWIL